MRGTELTKEQLDHAREFIARARTDKGPDHIPGDLDVTLPYHTLVRLVAWYGAVRAGDRPLGKIVTKP